jgi:hypothetical protein
MPILPRKRTRLRVIRLERPTVLRARRAAPAQQEQQPERSSLRNDPSGAKEPVDERVGREPAHIFFNEKLQIPKITQNARSASLFFKSNVNPECGGTGAGEARPGRRVLGVETKVSRRSMRSLGKEKVGAGLLESSHRILRSARTGLNLICRSVSSPFRIGESRKFRLECNPCR